MRIVQREIMVSIEAVMPIHLHITGAVACVTRRIVYGVDKALAGTDRERSRTQLDFVARVRPKISAQTHAINPVAPGSTLQAVISAPIDAQTVAGVAAGAADSRAAVLNAVAASAQTQLRACCVRTVTGHNVDHTQKSACAVGG